MAQTYAPPGLTPTKYPVKAKAVQAKPAAKKRAPPRKKK